MVRICFDFLKLFVFIEFYECVPYFVDVFFLCKLICI